METLGFSVIYKELEWQRANFWKLFFDLHMMLWHVHAHMYIHTNTYIQTHAHTNKCIHNVIRYFDGLHYIKWIKHLENHEFCMYILHIVCLFIYVCAYVCELHAPMYTCVHGYQGSVFLCCFLALYFWDRVSHWTQNLPFLARLAAWSGPRIVSLPPQEWNYMCATSCQGNHTYILMFAWKALWWLSHIYTQPPPPIFFSEKSKASWTKISS